MLKLIRGDVGLPPSRSAIIPMYKPSALVVRGLNEIVIVSAPDVPS
jgi:hypothetical protein